MWFDGRAHLQRILSSTGILVAVFGVLAGSPAPAAAQDSARDAEARNLFEAGRLAMTDGRFEESLDYFQRAYELSQRPALLYNVATVAERLGEDRVALEALETYLAEEPDIQDRRAVERRVELLRDRVSAGRADDPRAAPTPAETAAAGTAETPDAPDLRLAGTEAEPVDGDRRDDRLVTKWWLWAIVGAVVVGGAVTAGVLLSRDDGGIEDPIPGTNGTVVIAFGER